MYNSRIIVSVILSSAINVISCSRSHDSGHMARIAQLEQDLQNERHSSMSVRQELQEVQLRHESEREALNKEIQILRAQVEEQAQIIQSLSQTLVRAKAYVSQIRRQRNEVAAPNVSNNNPLYDDFIHPPVGSNPDLFPVYVFNIRGKKVVTGTRTEVNWKPNQVVVTDRYGYPISPSGKWREETVKEYDYQVIFSLKNLTKTIKMVRVDAGKGSRDFALPPGGSLENQVISALDGAPLNVTVSGQTRSFNVSK